MKAALLFLAIVALASVWVVEKLSATRLNVEIDAQREQAHELADLQRERARLRAKQPTAEELETLRAASAEHDRLQTEITARATARAAQPALSLGEWTPAGEWKNRGRTTSLAAVETTLWAAAGGDVAVLKNLLTLPADTREKADALLAQLPADARARYPRAEDLIAGFTVKNVPLGEAQLVWFNQTGEDDAVVCIFLQTPPKPGETTGTAATLPATPPPLTREEAVRAALQRKAERAANPNREPPHAPENEKSSATYLSLHRQADGWGLIVPSGAVDKIAKELQVAIPGH
jgi:hypothetical protein